jgi:hypothetical protein
MIEFQAITAVTMEMATVDTEVSEETNTSNFGQSGVFAVINTIQERNNFIHLKD